MLISIIIPAFNQADKLAITLNSISRQICSNYEIIVVNDGSLDDPEKVFNEFKASFSGNQHLLYISQENRGAPAARNRGFFEAKGDYLFFCDADANLKTEALLSLLKALEANPAAAYAYSSFMWGKKLFKVGDFDEVKLRTAPYIHTMSLIRRTDFPETGWDESIRKFQDWDLWLTMLEAGKKGVFVDATLFTISPGGTISSWLPSFAYRFFPFLKAVKKYNLAMQIIQEKHGLL